MLEVPADPEAVEIEVADPAGCPRYVGRLFRGCRIAESPWWLKARLRAAGMRAISNVVDITNYVMLELGSPLHAFDFERLAGGRIGVRRAGRGEELVTLDGVERRLDPSDLLITDALRASRAEVERLAALLERLTALLGRRRLYWLESNPDTSEESVHELAYSHDLEPGTVERIRRAVELPDGWIAVVRDPADSYGVLVTEHETEAHARGLSSGEP